MYHNKDNEAGRKVIEEWTEVYHHFKGLDWKANPEKAAAAAGKKARQALSPEQKKELDKQTFDAAGNDDPAKVLKHIEDGGDIEWRNPDGVSESVSQ